DSTFVEDTALIVTNRGAILTRPGAASRAGEVEAIRDSITAWYPTPAQIIAPGTLDAGDVCEANGHVFIGLSHRTNEEGARQLAEWLSTLGISAATIDIRNVPGILHLKSGVTAVDGHQLLAISALAQHEAFSGYDVLVVPDGEEYAANCIRVNGVLFVADGYPETHRMLRDAGFALRVLDMSEFARMDGGLSCLSLRS
ncbi:MAG: N(G),N(G)-dimethylarginine dimethylaminohydrolase, partial [Gemmatimonadaceae bacterium]